MKVNYPGAEFTQEKEGEAKEAIESFKQTIGNAPEKSASVFEKLVNQLCGQENPEEIVAFLDTLETEFPNQPEAYLELAKVTRQQKAWEQCLEVWKACFRLFPQEVEANWYIRKARACIELGDYEEAKRTYEAGIQGYPNEVWGFAGLAQVAHSREKWMEALENWAVCFDRFADEAEPWWYKQRQRALKALAHVREA